MANCQLVFSLREMSVQKRKIYHNLSKYSTRFAFVIINRSFLPLNVLVIAPLSPLFRICARRFLPALSAVQITFLQKPELPNFFRRRKIMGERPKITLAPINLQSVLFQNRYSSEKCRLLHNSHFVQVLFAVAPIFDDFDEKLEINFLSDEFSISARASVPIFFSFAPCLPIMIAFCEDRST